MIITLIADTHMRSRGPSSRRDDYPETLMTKLEWAYGVAKARESVSVWHLGDLFHFKDPSRTPFSTVLRLYEFLKTQPIPTLITLGNHDLQSSGVHSLNRQPIGLLIKAGALYRRSTLEIPNSTVVLTSVDHQPKMSDTLLSSIPTPAEGKFNVLGTHADITPDGQHNTISYEALSELGYDVIVYGHLHTTWGPQWVGRTLIFSVPSLMRGSISDASTDVPPAIALLHLSSGEPPRIEMIECPHEPADKVFSLQKHAHKKERSAFVKSFTTRLGTLDLKVKPLEQSLLELRGQLLPHQYNLLMEYLDEHN